MVFEYPADYLIYPYYLYYIGGSFSVMFVVVFAHAIEVTPISMRQGGIILMEMSLYMAEKGFEIEKFLIGSFLSVVTKIKPIVALHFTLWIYN